MTDLNEMEAAYTNLLQGALSESLGLVIYSPGHGETYPALVDMETGEMLAFLLIPPVLYDTTKVN